jgi:hypothetical protein
MDVRVHRALDTETLDQVLAPQIFCPVRFNVQTFDTRLT